MAEKIKKKITKSKKSKKKTEKVSTINLPPMKIDFVMKEDFVSRPLWKITCSGGLIYWPKNTEDKWDNKNYVKGPEGTKPPKLTGQFVELQSKITAKGVYYILVQNNSEEVWINVGKLRGTGGTRYMLFFNYAKQVRKAQYGIRGTAQVSYGDKTLDLKMLAVRRKVGSSGKPGGPYTLVPPGSYRGFIRAMGKSKKKYGEDALFNNPTIHFTNQWENNKWKIGIKKKNNARTSEVFIHRAEFPDQLDGCLALGRNETDYGFESFSHSLKTMREVFELRGIKTKTQFKNTQELKWGKKLKVLITVTDNRA